MTNKELPLSGTPGGRERVNTKIFPFFGSLRMIGPYQWLFIIALILLRLLTTLPHGVGFHPDERHIVMTVEKLSFKDPNPHSFAYGSLVFYLLAVVSWLTSFVYPPAQHYDNLFIVGRAISTITHLLIALLCYTTSYQLYKNRLFAFGSLFLCLLSPFFIQVSHFYTSDLFLTLFCAAALSSMIAIAQYGRLPSYIGAGFFIGLAVVSKITAISLLAPFFLAWLASRWKFRTFKSWQSWVFPIIALVVLGVVFRVVQPYAILDFETFWKDIWEQIHMVQGKIVFPYNLQHQNTPPYLYYIAQFPFTFGTPVALALFASVAFCLVKRPSRGEFLLIVWIFILFVIVGRYQVKFPRYLLPIYPALFILLGGGVQRLERYARNRTALYLPLGLILGGWSILQGFATVTLYWQDHPYIAASQWVYRNIPAGKTILSVHWDDKVPVDLPGYSSHQYQMWDNAYELAVFEPDTEAKIRAISDQLAGGDYLILPTPRAPIGILQTPEKHPYSTKLFKLLYGNGLGYTLEKTVKTRPQIETFVIDDDTGDESLSVYDHPKVAIFRNERRLPAQEIYDLVIGESPAPSLTKKQILSMDRGEEKGSVGEVVGGFLIWFLVVEILGALSLPILTRLFDPFLAAALARPLGLLHFTFLVWFLNSAGLIVASPRVLGWILVLLCPLLPVVSKGFGREWRSILALWSTIVFVVLLSRAFHPEVFWGEKPMDFTFLNYFVRSETLPPQDPWAVGHPMKYYYFGFYLFGILHKISGLVPSFGFNLAIATVSALLVVSLVGAIGTLLGGQFRRATIAGALSVAFLSNVEMARLLFTEKVADFNTFWASTRLFTTPAFSEYPVWSILFADLHAHFMSMPFFVLGMALLFRLMKQTTELSSTLLLTTLFGVTWGVLLPINGWDFITLSLLAATLYLFRLLWIVQEGRAVGERLVAVVSESLIALLVALLSMGYFLTRSMGGQQIGYGIVHAEEFNTLNMVLLMLGGWFAPLAVPLLSKAIKTNANLAKLAVRLTIALVPIGAFLFISWRSGAVSQPFPILIFASLLAILTVVAIGREEEADYTRSLPSLLILFAVWGVVTVELFYLIDRMNTVFKFYIHLWFLLGIATAAIFIRWYGSERSKTVKVISLFVCFVVVTGGLIGSGASVYAMAKLKRVEGPRPTLNGTAYLVREDSDEAEVIAYINRDIDGTPGIVEAFGDSYQAYTRVAMHTGLPTLLGWEHHVFQRGLPREAIAERQRAIERIYRTSSIEEAIEYLDRYQIEYLFAGRLEREKYGSFGLEKFSSSPLFERVYSSGEVVLYRVKR